MNSLSTALKQIRRTPYQALAAILTLSLTSFTIAAFSLILLGFNAILSHFEKQPQIVAFFQKGQDLSDADLAAIKDELDETGQLESFHYTSTKDAEAKYKEENKADPILNELVDYKILPPSIEITAKGLDGLAKLKAVLKDNALVKDVIYNEDVVENVKWWFGNIRTLGLSFISFLSVLSMLILIIVISMKIKNKRSEIEIMRLLGASQWYVLMPFIFEGMIYGSIGSFIGWLISFTTLQYTTPFLLSKFEGIIPLPVDMQILGAQLLAMLLFGQVVGALSSILAVRRFVKV